MGCAISVAMHNSLSAWGWFKNHSCVTQYIGKETEIPYVTSFNKREEVSTLPPSLPRTGPPLWCPLPLPPPFISYTVTQQMSIRATYK